MQLFLAVLTSAFLIAAPVTAQECGAAANTLTTSCSNDSCGAYEPCLVSNSTECSNSSSDRNNGFNGCSYTCFRPFGAYNSDPTQFLFVISFTSQNTSSDGVYATANNDVLTAIDQLTLSPQTTSVWIGGGDYQQIVKGNVVELELADNLLTESQVTSVSLVSMNLSTRIFDIPSMLPSSASVLSLANTLLTQFPLLPNVTTLNVSENYITNVNESISWEKLSVLDLRRNNVSSFEGNFPGLTDLYLNDNNLTEIPEVIFSLQHLTKLSIQGNPLATRTFTEFQADFLQEIILDLTDSDFQRAANCSVPEQRVVNNVVVCISDLSTKSLSSSGSSSSPSSTASSGSSGLPTSRISYSSGSNGMENSRSNDAETSSLLVIALIAALVVFATVIATGMYYWKQRNREKTTEGYTIPRNSSKQQAEGIWNDCDLVDLQVNCDGIQDIRVIGSGNFTVVWLVRYCNSELLASKRLREDLVVTERTLQAFLENIKLVSKLDHPNIVAFMGAAWATGSGIQALFEFIENGDLRTYLSPARPRYWTRVKLQLAVDVIEALIYIHAFTSPVVHGDLKSKNVLISTDMQAKLCGFRSESKMTTEIGTNRWLAPEILSGSHYDESADIFSFGVLLSEFDTHSPPYDDIDDDDMPILQKVARGTLRPTFSETCPPIILELAKQCTAQNPRDRPPASKVAYALRTLQREAFNM
ncbi:hypothetical protein V7S43_013107 [Phytophthora oleae]|uniref:Protein kinase domain-containing protein n=1 Tax=Phytophthora oleae TaxID=2107226 RepID=A0ABD3F520_9STRA